MTISKEFEMRGFQQGFQQGFREGYQEGYRKGYKEGYRQGIQEAMQNVAKNLLALKANFTLMVDVTESTMKEILALHTDEKVTARCDS